MLMDGNKIHIINDRSADVDLNVQLWTETFKSEPHVFVWSNLVSNQITLMSLELKFKPNHFKNIFKNAKSLCCCNMLGSMQPRLTSSTRAWSDGDLKFQSLVCVGSHKATNLASWPLPAKDGNPNSPSNEIFEKSSRLNWPNFVDWRKSLQRRKASSKLNCRVPLFQNLAWASSIIALPRNSGRNPR